MGITLTEAKLGDEVRLTVRRFRDTKAGGTGLLDFEMHVSGGTLTVDNKPVRHYIVDVFADLGLTQAQIDEMKQRLVIAVSKLAQKLGVNDGTP